VRRWLREDVDIDRGMHIEDESRTGEAVHLSGWGACRLLNCVVCSVTTEEEITSDKCKSHLSNCWSMVVCSVNRITLALQLPVLVHPAGRPVSIQSNSPRGPMLRASRTRQALNVPNLARRRSSSPLTVAQQ
jgi:hypothetical protein